MAIDITKLAIAAATAPIENIIEAQKVLGMVKAERGRQAAKAAPAKKAAGKKATSGTAAGAKKGPGRPPGSTNKPKAANGGGAAAPIAPTLPVPDPVAV